MTNPINERGPRSGDDLIWTAYQYTADELPEPAARAFEASLETDQQAREALAEAVSLADTIRASLGSEEAAPALMPASLVAQASPAHGAASYGWARSIAWVALGAAACLVLTVVLRDAPQGAPGPVAEQPAAKAGAEAGKTDDHHLLAVLFPEGSDHDPAAIVGVDPLDVAAADPDAGMYDENTVEAMPETSAPDWLLAAVAEDSE